MKNRFTETHSEVLHHEVLSHLQKLPNWLLDALERLLDDGQVFAVQQLLGEAHTINEGGRS